MPLCEQTQHPSLPHRRPRRPRPSAATDSTYYRTPNIDRLAAQGVRFNPGLRRRLHLLADPRRHPHRQAPRPPHAHRLASRRPLGRYSQTPNRPLPARPPPSRKQPSPKPSATSGYRTGIVGKWHLGGEPFNTPAHHGFDISIAANDHGNPGRYFAPYRGKWKIPTTKLKAEWELLPGAPDGEYLTDRLTDEAINFIEDSGDQPFFLYLSHYAVHTPLQAKPAMTAAYEKIPEAERQGDPKYAAMIESVDESVGKVLAALEKRGLTKDNSRPLPHPTTAPTPRPPTVRRYAPTRAASTKEASASPSSSSGPA